VTTEPHFRVEKMTTPIVVSRVPRIALTWAVICTVTGGRHAAKRSRKEAEFVAGMEGETACWLCAEAARGQCVRQIAEGRP
jgi:hypothetical protein